MHVVKVLPLNKSTPQAIVNFTREIRTQAQLDHPNIVTAYDAEQEGQLHFLVMEYVEGIDLAKTVALQGVLRNEQACRAYCSHRGDVERIRQQRLEVVREALDLPNDRPVIGIVGRLDLEHRGRLWHRDHEHECTFCLAVVTVWRGTGVRVSLGNPSWPNSARTSL